MFSEDLEAYLLCPESYWENNLTSLCQLPFGFFNTGWQRDLIGYSSASFLCPEQYLTLRGKKGESEERKEREEERGNEEGRRKRKEKGRGRRRQRRKNKTEMGRVEKSGAICHWRKKKKTLDRFRWGLLMRKGWSNGCHCNIWNIPVHWQCHASWDLTGLLSEFIFPFLVLLAVLLPSFLYHSTPCPSWNTRMSDLTTHLKLL